MLLFLILISFLLGYLLLRFFQRYDLYEKEPISVMGAVAVVGGIVSIALALGLYQLVKWFGFSQFTSDIGLIFFVAPIEELSKLLALYITYPIFRKEMNEPTDGVIYMSCVVLGFSLIENLFYAMPGPDTHALIFIRVFTSTPAHILFSMFMGLGFYMVKKKVLTHRFLLLTYFYAISTHALYNLSLFNGWPLFYVLLLFYISFRALNRLLEYTSAKSPFRVSLKSFVEQTPFPPMEPGLECLHCGDTSPKPTYRIGKIMFQKCVQCPYYITSLKSLSQIFHHFASKFSNVSSFIYSHLPFVENPLIRHHWISLDKKLAIFELGVLHHYLETIRQNIVLRFESNRWFQKNLVKHSRHDLD
ncbi:MAG: PrsW family intramembrane metalloprotease [Calditrichaeota bacterium]|nr:PrsW family intramembrane metalloprotease [Calditrichota bacterium]